jgi:carbon monoxide dehydrogenase subunit G
MEITDSFRVSTPLEDTWKVLLDIERIAPCLPGAQLQEIDGDEYRGVVKVKVGPITAQYKGRAILAEVDEANRRITIDAQGRDTRGQGNAKATILVAMADDAGGTRVDVTTDLSITGKVAQFGRGVLADVSSKLMGQFVENLERDVLGAAGGVDTGGGVTEVVHGEVREAAGPGAPPPAGGEVPLGAYEEREAATLGPDGAAAASGVAAARSPRRVEHPEAEPVDLLGVAGAPAAKRLVPLGIGLVVLLLLWRAVRRRRR